jgi:hypothetical protein
MLYSMLASRSAYEFSAPADESNTVGKKVEAALLLAPDGAVDGVG